MHNGFDLLTQFVCSRMCPLHECKLICSICYGLTDYWLHQSVTAWLSLYREVQELIFSQVSPTWTGVCNGKTVAQFLPVCLVYFCLHDSYRKHQTTLEMNVFFLPPLCLCVTHYNSDITIESVAPCFHFLL